MCSRSATRRVRGHRAGSPAAVPDACPRPARAPQVRPRCAPLPTRRCPRAGLNRSSGCTCRDTSSIILSPEQHPRRQRLRAPRQGWAHAHPRDGRLIGTPRRVGAPTARVSPATVDPFTASHVRGVRHGSRILSWPRSTGCDIRRGPVRFATVRSPLLYRLLYFSPALRRVEGASFLAPVAMPRPRRPLRVFAKSAEGR
jgi:hypothetical protein